MTAPNNTTRTRAHEACAAKQVIQVYRNATNRLIVTDAEQAADAHDRAYRASWSAPDTDPEDNSDGWYSIHISSLWAAVALTAIIFAGYGLGLGYLLFHP